MKKLSKPTLCPIKTYNTCISKVRNPNLKLRLSGLRGAIKKASNEYSKKGDLLQFHNVKRSKDVGRVSKKEIVKVYKSRMAKIGAPGRIVYDQLIVSPPQKRCPYCGQRDVSTLDHYLPESKFTKLVVNPLNLVPSCSNCNKSKDAYSPKNESSQLFHPYYDDFDDGVWLKAKIERTNPLSVRFLVKKPRHWDDTKFLRVKEHFKIMKLDALYSDHAVSELVGTKLRISDLFELGGEAAVKEDLKGRYKSIRKVRPNSWQAALWNVTSQSSWFCKKGFKNIPEEE